MNDTTLANYLFDLGYEIKLRALEAKEEREREGTAEGLNEVISIMQQNAESFGIPLSALRLDGIVPDRDLV